MPSAIDQIAPDFVYKLSKFSQFPSYGEAMINECRSKEDFHRPIEESRQCPVFLFKHSTVCPVSAGAMRQFTYFAEEEDGAKYWQVLVREDKEISNMIAAETGISHESPQLILFRDGKPVWNCSHRAIRGDAMSKQLEQPEN